MFKRYVLLSLFFCAALVSAEPNEGQIQAAFDAFKASPAYTATLALGQCSRSIAFLEQLNHDFRYELDDAKRTQYIQMIEQILYQGRGVGGFLGRACNARERAIMTEAAFLLELWHQNRGIDCYFLKKNLVSDNPLVQEHYLILKYISIVASKMFDDLGTKRFFKDAIPEIVSVIQEFDPDMTEEKFLKIPSFRQVDVLVANLSASLCFYEQVWNRAEDYLDLEVDDGLNGIRANMRVLMNANTIAEATVAVAELEVKCWALPLEMLEAASIQIRDLIGRAFAAIERIKSVSLEGTFLTKDSRAIEDKFAALAVPADEDPERNARDRKRHTLLLLISMVLQERFYNPLYAREDMKKIILAKLQQSNYWEGDTALLTNKTDLEPYPTELPHYADEAIRMVKYNDTVPKVYKLFVDNIRQQALAKRGSGYAPGNNIHYVGGNTFLHLASLGDGQCGFFSMGLLDDGLGAYQLTNSNARQKFLEILANSLELQTLYDTAAMSGVTDWIQKYVEGNVATLNGPSGEALVPFLLTLDRVTIQQALVPLGTEFTQENTRIKDEFGMQETVAGSGSFTYEDNSSVSLARKQVDLPAEDYALLLEKIKREDGIKDLVKANRNAYFIKCNKKYVENLRGLLLTNPHARRAFSAHVLQALAGKLLPEEQPVISFERILSSMECQRLDLQLLFSPGSARYIDVASSENRMIPLPTQTIAETLGINMQVITTPEVANEGLMFVDLVADPSRVFSPGLYVLQDLLVSPSAKNVVIWNFGGGHYEKLVPLSDPVSLARALRHLSWITWGIGLKQLMDFFLKSRHRLHPDSLESKS